MANLRTRDARVRNPTWPPARQKRRLKNVNVGGKPSTMVTAGKTCKAPHFEKEDICAQFFIKFHYLSVLASKLFLEDLFFIFHFFRNKTKIYIQFFIATLPEDCDNEYD